jgi:hypothetical protein
MFPTEGKRLELPGNVDIDSGTENENGGEDHVAWTPLKRQSIPHWTDWKLAESTLSDVPMLLVDESKAG